MRKVTLDAADPAATVRIAKLKISPAAAVQILLTAEQPNYVANMNFNGFTPEVLERLRLWLNKEHPGALKLGYALREIVNEQREQLDEAVFERYGVHLPSIENFWYADFGGAHSDTIQDPGFGNPIGGLTVSANFLTARRFHTARVNTQSNFFSIFMRKQLETAHFIAWSRTIQDLKAIYGDLGVQNVLIKEQGRDAWNVLKKRRPRTLRARGSAAIIR